MEQELLEFFKKDRFAANAGAELLEIKEGYGPPECLLPLSI